MHRNGEYRSNDDDDADVRFPRSFQVMQSAHWENRKSINIINTLHGIGGAIQKLINVNHLARISPWSGWLCCKPIDNRHPVSVAAQRLGDEEISTVGKNGLSSHFNADFPRTRAPGGAALEGADETLDALQQHFDGNRSQDQAHQPLQCRQPAGAEHMGNAFCGE